MRAPTARQKQVLDFIVHSIGLRGFPPTIREICKHFGIASPQAASRHLLALEKKGFIKRSPRVARSICVLPHVAQSISVLSGPELEESPSSQPDDDAQKVGGAQAEGTFEPPLIHPPHPNSQSQREGSPNSLDSEGLTS